jgi:hypothetical protein
MPELLYRAAPASHSLLLVHAVRLASSSSVATESETFDGSAAIFASAVLHWVLTFVPADAARGGAVVVVDLLDDDPVIAPMMPITISTPRTASTLYRQPWLLRGAGRIGIGAIGGGGGTGAGACTVHRAPSQ